MWRGDVPEATNMNLNPGKICVDRINRIDRIRSQWPIPIIAMQAGDMRLKYDIPTIDPIIAATCICMVENMAK
jgi:hypothetical protein